MPPRLKWRAWPALLAVWVALAACAGRPPLLDVGGSLPIPGTSLEVKVPLERAVYLPQAALQQVDGHWGVFVAGQGEAVFRPVRRGLDVKDEVLVLEGLKPGETVVAEGAYLLKAFRQKRAQPEEGGGHGH